MKIERYTESETFADSACKAVCSELEQLIKKDGSTSLFLAGGTSPVPVYHKLKKCNSIDWQNVIVGIGDERWAPDKPELQNSLMVSEELYFDSCLKAAGFHAVPMLEDPEECALYYSRLLEKSLENASPGVVILGMGPDGHTASLFPGFDCPDSPFFVHTPAPKIDPQVPRISCTYSFLERAASLIFIVKSAGKEEILEKVLAGDTSFPAGKAANRPAVQWHILD